MDKYKTLIIVALSSLFIIGCDISPVYTVRQAEEGIITQNGKIIGEPKRPGLHFKIPLIQQVHLVNIHFIRVSSFPISNSSQIKMFWQIKDSKQYFTSIQQNNDPQFGLSIISLELDKFLKTHDVTLFTSAEIIMIKEQLQPSVNDYGLSIVNVAIDEQ